VATDNVSAVRAALDAQARDEIEPLADLMAPDVVWHVPGVHRFAGEFRGRQEVLDLMLRQTEASIRTSFDEIHAVVGDDEHVVALVRATLTGPGGSVPMRSVLVFHFDGARIEEFWAMNDRQDEIDLVVGR
jgi:ketosteroid isomerase-like protein